MIWRCLSLVIGLVLAAAVARAEGVVVSSTAPGLTVGRVVGDDETLHLPGDSLAVVLLPSGGMVTLSGPYDGKVPSAPAGATGEAKADWRSPDLSALGGARGEVRPSLGGTNDAATVLVDASRSGTWCVGPHAQVRLAAPPGRPATLHLDGTILTWPPGLTEQPWPDSLPLHDGLSVQAKWGEAGAAQTLTFRLLAEDQDPPSRLVHWAAAGCRQQAEPQLRALGAKAAPFALYLATDRGRTPRYALGESVKLVAQANRPAALYCFVLQDGQAHALYSGKLADQEELRFTADRLPIDITAPPPRLAELRCYALSGPHPPVDWTPAKWSGPGPAGSRLDRAFGNIPDTEVARAGLMVRTE